MNLKICGLREAENVLAVAELKPQMMGFIFTAASPRYFYASSKPAVLRGIKDTKKVGVFVNQSEEEINEQVKLHALDFVQLHGTESIDACKRLAEQGVKLIKAFNVDGFDFESINGYCPYVEYFLFDTVGKSHGGNGVKFDWGILQNRRFQKLFLLSGGIGPGDVDAIKNFHHPDMWGIDLNSRFEISPGLKDVEAIKLFKQEFDL